MSATIQDVIVKVQKLRRLATSDNLNEANAAAAAADKLIQEHRLHESQLEAESGESERPEESSEPIRMGTRRGWTWRLVTGLCRHYDCASYSSWRRYGSTDERTIHLIGRKSDVETIRYQAAYFTLEIDRLARASVKGKAALHAFRLGAVYGLLNALYASKRAVVEATATPTSSAMVFVGRKKEAEDTLAKLHPDLASSRPLRGQFSDGNAFNAGKRAGAGLHTSAQIGSGSTRLLGGTS